MNDVVVQSDSKIILAGGMFNSVQRPTLVRLTANGDFDPSFSGDGFLTFEPVEVTGTYYSLALQGDGKIVAVGTAVVSGDFQVLLARYNTDGTLDETFDGDGYTVTNFSIDDNGFDVEIMSDGRIVVVGSARTGSQSIVLVARYTSTGALDTTFSSDGIMTYHPGPNGGLARSVAIQPDGSIVAAGTLDPPDAVSRSFGMIRVTEAGELDTTFDTDGVVTTILPLTDSSEGREVAIAPDGKIVLVGEAVQDGTGQHTIARYNTDGSLDATFDLDGHRVLDIAVVVGGNLFDVEVMSDLKIVAAGLGAIPGNSTSLIMRFNPDGSLDDTFGPAANRIESGVVRVDQTTGSEEFQSIDFTPDGRIVAAGKASVGIGVVRFFGTGAAIASAESFTMNEDATLTVATPGVKANDAIPADDPATAILVASTTQGQLTFSADGSFNYVPYPNFHGVDTFQYRLKNGFLSAPVTVSITVLPINDAPIAVTDFYQLSAVSPVVISDIDGVLFNDYDAESQSITAVLVTPPEQGTLNLNPDGSFTYTFDPLLVSRASFTYKVTDGVAESAPQTVVLARTPQVLVDGTVLRISGTAGQDTIRLRSGGGRRLSLEIFSPAGLMTQVVEPNVLRLPFSLVEVRLSNGDDRLDTSAIRVPIRAIGGAGNDVIRTGAGADQIFGDEENGLGFGVNNIDAGDGNNTIVGGNGDNWLRTGRNNDAVTVGNGDNTIDTGAGNDTVTGGNGQSAINTGAGNDSISVGTGGNVVDGGAGNDFISAQGGTNWLIGGLGNDVVLGGIGADIIDGGVGNDFLAGGMGSDRVDGGAGNDLLFDGEVVVSTPATDSLAKVLANYNPASTTLLRAITQRLVVIPDPAGIDTMLGGLGRDWFWTANVLDTTDRITSDWLNSIV